MPTPTRFAIALAVLPACGVSLEDYDARTAELRKAEERATRCGAQLKQADQSLNAGTQDVSELRRAAERLRREQLDFGLDTEFGRRAVRRAIEEAARDKQSSATRARDREQLASGLRDEIGAGLVALDDRKEVLRIVLPEEALFASGQALLGPPGKK